MTRGVIKEDWQEEIVIRDKLDALCLLQRIADFLYPDATLLADDRMQKLRRFHPQFVGELEPICRRKLDECDAMLREWRARSKAA